MNKRSVILIASGAIVLVGAVALTLRDREPASPDPDKATPSAQAIGATPAQDTSEMTTQQAPMQRPEPFVPPPSAGTGVSRPSN